MKLSEYIKMLITYSKTAPDIEVCMTHSGYYADGELADLYDLPEIRSIVTKEVNQKFTKGIGWTVISPEIKQDVIVLGHSHQSY